MSKPLMYIAFIYGTNSGFSVHLYLNAYSKIEPYFKRAKIMNQNDPCKNIQKEFTDHGNNPYVMNLRMATLCNDFFRRTLWTGDHLQLTVMSIPVGGEIGLEIHPDVDQVIYIESGFGLAMMGSSHEKPDMKEPVSAGASIFVPNNTWHNIANMGRVPLKVFSIYAPPNHPFNTIHKTKAEAEKEHAQEEDL